MNIIDNQYINTLKKFITSHRIFTAVRITFAIMVPAIIFGYFGIFKEAYLFPIGTSFLALVDQPGPFIRRRNTLILAIFSFFIVATIASLLQFHELFIYIEIAVFGIFFSILGVYGPRLGGVGSMSLIVLAVFIDGHLAGAHVIRSIAIFISGGLWYLLLLLFLSKLQPYKLAKQLVGENYMALAKFLEIKALFYDKNPDYKGLMTKLMDQQVRIKNIQEETRDLMFRTRKFINESTTVSRLLIFKFISSIDLFDKLITSENDYELLHQKFGKEQIFDEIETLLLSLSKELERIGLNTQADIQSKPLAGIDEQLERCFTAYITLRNEKMTSENLDDFMILKQILIRVKEVTNEIQTICSISSQDITMAKSLSSGLDVTKFTPSENPLNFKVLRNNFSFKSVQFRHSFRLTLAMLIGYAISQLNFHNFGHSYWVLITTVAVMRPGYGISKNRNYLRLGGTVIGAIIGFLFIYFSPNAFWQSLVIFISMILCFALLRVKYFWAVFFMTIYVLLAFNLLNPQGFLAILQDRLFDTALACVVALSISYFVFPEWEKKQTNTMFANIVDKNTKYFTEVISRLQNDDKNDEQYRMLRKDAIIALANLSDHFQKLVSDPKNKQENLELIHQFVTTSHLKTAYIASLSQYVKTSQKYAEIDFLAWKNRIISEFDLTLQLLTKSTANELVDKPFKEPKDLVENLVLERKKEFQKEPESVFVAPKNISKVAELKNIQELLKLIYAISKEQRKIAEKLGVKNQIQ